MDKILQTLFSEFGRTILSFAVLLMGLFSYITDRTIDNEIMQWTVWFLYALAIIQIFYSIAIINSKKIIHSLWVFIQNKILKYKHFKIITENFDLLPKKQKDILWELYFQKKLTLKYSSEVKNLSLNAYIYKIQAVTPSEAIYALNKKIITFLATKFIEQMKSDLQHLSIDEKKILNLFYNEEHKDKYNSEDEYALNLLIAKKIIERKDDKQIVISKYAKKLVKYFRGDKIKYNEIELGKHNIFILPDVGAGARGNFSRSHFPSGNAD